MDALALPSKDCLVDPETAGRDREQSAVGRDFITDRDGDDIAWDKLGSMNTGDLTGPKDFCFVGRVFLESLG
jgi:hypothetical protein